MLASFAVAAPAAKGYLSLSISICGHLQSRRRAEPTEWNWTRGPTQRYVKLFGGGDGNGGDGGGHLRIYISIYLLACCMYRQLYLLATLWLRYERLAVSIALAGRRLEACFSWLVSSFAG